MCRHKPGPYPVSDIAFSHQGAMILAQRAPVAGSYDYSAFTKPAEPRVLRYWLENPDDPNTPSKWIAKPEEYAVGFAGTYRNTNGGVALGYGYGRRSDGQLVEATCEYALWTTGQNLRNNPALRQQLDPGGPLVVNGGLHGSPADQVRTSNEPPTVNRSLIDYDDRFEDPTATGHLGACASAGAGRTRRPRWPMAVRAFRPRRPISSPASRTAVVEAVVVVATATLRSTSR